jgi:hypothetical protein
LKLGTRNLKLGIRKLKLVNKKAAKLRQRLGISRLL